MPLARHFYLTLAFSKTFLHFLTIYTIPGLHCLGFRLWYYPTTLNFINCSTPHSRYCSGAPPSSTIKQTSAMSKSVSSSSDSKAQKLNPSSPTLVSVLLHQGDIDVCLIATQVRLLKSVLYIILYNKNILVIRPIKRTRNQFAMSKYTQHATTVQVSRTTPEIVQVQCETSGTTYWHKRGTVGTAWSKQSLESTLPTQTKYLNPRQAGQRNPT